MYIVRTKTKEYELDDMRGMKLASEIKTMPKDSFVTIGSDAIMVAEIRRVEKESNKEDTAAAKDAKRIKEIMIQMNKYYRDCRARNLKDKVDATIRRITTGMTEDQKNEFASSYADCREGIEKYLSDKPFELFAPYGVWKDYIRTKTGKSTIYYAMVVKNDNAIYRWQNKLGEWTDWGD